jgi:hypothetical protein
MNIKKLSLNSVLPHHPPPPSTPLKPLVMSEQLMENESDFEESVCDMYADEYANESCVSSVAKHRPVMEKPHGHHRISRCIKQKHVPVELFTTRTTPGSRIRNAVTGHYENVLVGRVGEYQYFKVALATGELGADAPSTHLYYDSPEQYERHMGAIVSPEIKQLFFSRL